MLRRGGFFRPVVHRRRGIRAQVGVRVARAGGGSGICGRGSVLVVVRTIYIEDILIVQYIEMGTFVLLGLWWFLLAWRLRHLWLLDLQEFFIQNKM